jgi:hypothetical protein
MRDYHAKRRESGRKAAYMRDYYHERKKRLRDLKQKLTCVRCGFSDPRALEFHHRDPAAKNFKISEKAWSYAWSRIEEEIAKCDVLCSNCHRIEHNFD